MRHAFVRQRLAWSAVSLAMLAATAGCGSPAVSLPAGPTTAAAPSGFHTAQAWLPGALGFGLLAPGATPLDLGTAQWGRPFAAGDGWPLILPYSSLFVGSGIQMLLGTWPYRSILYNGV